MNILGDPAEADSFESIDNEELKDFYAFKNIEKNSEVNPDVNLSHQDRSVKKIYSPEKKLEYEGEILNS